MGDGGNFNFHFANGGWEVLMETDLPVKPKAETTKVVFPDGAIIKLLDDERLMLAHGLECPHILRHIHPH